MLQYSEAVSATELKKSLDIFKEGALPIIWWKEKGLIYPDGTR